MSELAQSYAEFITHESDKKHIALLYDNQEDALDLEFQFIRNGLKKNENCIYATEEDPGFIILKMINYGIPYEYLKKLFHVYRMPHPFNDPSGPLAGCENIKKMLFTDLKSPFRIVARLVSNIADMDGIKLEMMKEHETHEKFAEFDGTLMCSYDISKIEQSKRKEWLSQIHENHHAVIYLPKTGQRGILTQQQQKKVFTFDLRSKLKDMTNNIISFSQKCEYFCVGLVDIVNSTGIVSKLSSEQSCMYYSIFLNIMSGIVKEFGGLPVKNIGDSLLFYFPDTNGSNSIAFRSVLDCGMFMLKSNKVVNEMMSKRKLPHIDYRISSDYGRIAIAESATSINKDVFGPTVNMCSKINHYATPNSMIIGGDLYQWVKKEKGYNFKELGTYSIDDKFPYSVYQVDFRS